MKLSKEELEFVKDLYITDGKTPCEHIYNPGIKISKDTNLDDICKLPNGRECPIKIYTVCKYQLPRCQMPAAYEAAREILEKNYPLEYFELVLIKEIK
jgi:hypothetical protein